MASWSTVVALALVLQYWAAAPLLQVVDASRPFSQRQPWSILGSKNTGLSVAELEYYVQVDTQGPDLGVLIEAINTTKSNNFGRTQLFAFNVTEGADPTSTLLGVVYGYTVQASYTTTVRAVEVEILEYDDGSLSGTVSIQGLILNAPTEVSIVGGTGDFRGASGYGLVTLVNSTGSIVLYHHELHFL